LRRVQKDKSQLGEKVAVSGNTEIVELATDFNNMSSELNTLYRTLENMAFTDALTGMPNRVLFYDRLEQATLTTSRYNTQYAVMMMDLNRFKNINDTLGHHIGDQILKTVGERLQLILRKSDTIARLGGDEFSALLPAVDGDENATIVAQKIVNALNEPISVEGRSLSVGISIGIVRCPRDGHNSSLLMQRADIAMYHAKREGLGFVFYEESMVNDNLFELTMESELRQAVESKNFELYYQPKIDIQEGNITGAEALIRWIHDEHGFISPEKFIPLAEQTGLIQPLTEWVLEQALSQCAAWHANNIHIGISVNLSAYSLNDIHLLDTVRHALARAKIEPHWLTLELTETAIMSDADRALTTLSRLNSMGVRLSVDDFGTGYSSLAYLKRFPVDEIKIDKSFVMDMLDDASDAVIVRSTIDLAHNMGMKVVAEGIETQDAWDTLAVLGCNIGQGYHMCRPCPAADFEKWVHESPWGKQPINTAS
jgi:diguanylate cyclase (GGDEF)-like protein